MLQDDDVFWTALWNTLIFLGSQPIAIALALGIALLVNSDLKGASVYRTIVFLSYPLMTVAVAIIWRWMYNEHGGLINYVLRQLGVIHQPIAFLDSFAWALPSTIVANTWQVLGFFMIVLLSGLQNIPPHLYEAARVDGAPACARFFRITVPMLRPALFLCLVIGMLNSFSAFDLIYVMTNGGPGHATELLITYIYKEGFGETRFDYAAALTVAQFAMLMLLDLDRSSRGRRQCGSDRMTSRRHRLLWLRHSALVVMSVVMLAPFYWVLKTAITGENIYRLSAAPVAGAAASVQLRRRLVLDSVPALSVQQRRRLADRGGG